MKTKQRKSLLWRKFGYVILIIIKYMLNFCLEFLQELSMLWEAISNTRKSVSSDFETLWSWLKKKTQMHLVFFNLLLSVWKSDETLFLVFDILIISLKMKHCMSRNGEQWDAFFGSWESLSDPLPFTSASTHCDDITR